MRYRCFGGDRGLSGRGDPATNQRVRGFHLWEAEKEVAFRWDNKKIKFVGRRKDRVTLKIKEVAAGSSGISLPWAGLCHLLYLSYFLLRLLRPSANTSHILLNSFPMIRIKRYLCLLPQSSTYNVTFTNSSILKGTIQQYCIH